MPKQTWGYLVFNRQNTAFPLTFRIASALPFSAGTLDCTFSIWDACLFKARSACSNLFMACFIFQRLAWKIECPLFLSNPPKCWIIAEAESRLSFFIWIMVYLHYYRVGYDQASSTHVNKNKRKKERKTEEALNHSDLAICTFVHAQIVNIPQYST